MSRLHHCLLSLVLVAVGFASVRYWPREPLAARIESSTALFDRNGRMLRLTLARDAQYRLWTELEDVSPQFLTALLLHEDRHFSWHPGVNPLALLRAAVKPWDGAAHRGGSTLTMQLARRLYGLNTHTIGGKLLVMARALQLELCYSKHDLLEAHVNLIAYGSNVQGIGAASRIYFDKPAHALSLTEASSLVSMPQFSEPGPGAAEPHALRTAREQPLQRWQQTRVLRARPQAGAELTDAALPVHYRHVSELPFLAPHFTTYLLATTPPAARAAAIHTTLDVPLQRLLERVLQSYVRERGVLGIHNAAALLVDHRDLAVRAMIGSADFHAVSSSGQINGTLIRRAPGGTLEPLVHALAVDQGSLHRGASTTSPALSVALSGAEVTMEQVATLYAMLANHGEIAPLRYRSDAAPHPRVRVLSAATSAKTLEMLTATARPSGRVRPADGLRDAWTAGVLGPYVLVVWVGNFDDSAHPALDGDRTAAPLFFQMLDALAAADPRLLEPAPTAPIRLARGHATTLMNSCHEGPRHPCAGGGTRMVVQSTGDLCRFNVGGARVGDSPLAPIARDPKKCGAAHFLRID